MLDCPCRQDILVVGVGVEVLVGGVDKTLFVGLSGKQEKSFVEWSLETWTQQNYTIG